MSDEKPDPEDLTPGTDRDLERDIAFAMRHHARSHFRFKRDDPAPDAIAARAVAYLKLANWKFFRGPPAKPHSTPDSLAQRKAPPKEGGA